MDLSSSEEHIYIIIDSSHRSKLAGSIGTINMHKTRIFTNRRKIHIVNKIEHKIKPGYTFNEFVFIHPCNLVLKMIQMLMFLNFESYR